MSHPAPTPDAGGADVAPVADDLATMSPRAPRPEALATETLAPFSLRLRWEETVPVLVVPEAVPFAELREHLGSALAPLAADLRGKLARLDLGARALVLFDVRRLLHALKELLDVEVTALYVEADAIQRFAERELKLKLFPTRPSPASGAGAPGASTPSTSADLGDAAAPASPSGTAEEAGGAAASVMPGLADVLSALGLGDDADGPLGAPLKLDPAPAVRRPVPLPDLPEEEPLEDADGGRRTLNLRRTLRSGTSIRYDGDVVVWGDVNPGAVISAAGNILVLGKLKGTVHAGHGGDPAAFIMAHELLPAQLRIADAIAIAPPRTSGQDPVPEMAQIVDGRIILEPYRGRLRR
jgi:septum site-determining protein MinC